MTTSDLRKLLRDKGCVEMRQTGSHLIVRCGECQTTLPIHHGDIPKGTLAAIKRHLAPCLGEDWLK
ncbi:MAG: type II toxin-antitoxin system HicA family toxin [Acidimicrobiia bacterium]